MRVNKTIGIVLLMTFAWLASVSTFVLAGSADPVNLLQSIADNMIRELKANKATLKSKPQIVYKLAYRYVVPHADMPEMSKRVLSPQVWDQATPEQRSRFQKQFTTLLIRTYASALTSYQDQTIKFYPVRGDYQSMSSVEVSSDIVSPSSDPVHVTYRMLRVGGSWELYDMSVEGVSLIESFRSQFADILATGNMEVLLSRMTNHNTGESRS
jgi:phospholipid transport system substrate-binding protein